MSFWNTCILAYCRLGIAGLSPKAPGTAGSALAALLAPLLFLPLPLWGRLLFLAVIVVTGGLAATRAEILLGRTDPGEVVIDELVGVWIALLPLGAGQWSWPGLVWAFALFRLFDIWKPWPVHASENWLPAGWGIMLDDILAGLMAMCCMLVLRALGCLARGERTSSHAAADARGCLRRDGYRSGETAFSGRAARKKAPSLCAFLSLRAVDAGG